MPLTNVDLDRIDGNSGLLANVSTSALNGGPLAGARNRIINGDMRIDQRNAGASVSLSAGGYYVDRWQSSVSQTGKATAQRNAGSVTPPVGFTNYLGITSSSAYSVLTGDYFSIQQIIEGFNVADLGWGAANPVAVTLSFWVRSSLTGTHSGVIKNGGANRSYPFTFTISSANTWEYKTITIPGDSSGTWATDNTFGIQIGFNLGSGATFSGTAGAWSGSNLVGATGATSVVGTNGATFYITGVQLEAGTVATPFERRSYGQELALCQRYYEKSYAIETVPGTAGRVGYCVAGGTQGATTAGEVNTGTIRFAVTKRATPSMLVYDFSGNVNKCSRVNASVADNSNQTVVITDVGPGSFLAYSPSGTTATGAGVHFTASIEL